ncbi:MAG: DUF4040 domain-containing protein [Idiomarina sp.]|nr:DUF4040 domain-containing protein [Idiomarina sp.]
MTFIDLLIGVGLVFIVVAILVSQDLFRAVVLFVTFGVLLTLAWVRLQAPDLALAEAAIGAGLTGVLLLDAIGFLRKRKAARKDRDNKAIRAKPEQGAANE